EAAAGGAVPGSSFTVATDARRKEVYWARYTAGGSRLHGPEVGPPGDAADGGPVAGEGPWLYPAELGPPAGPRYPSAAALAALVAGRLAAGGGPPARGRGAPPARAAVPAAPGRPRTGAAQAGDPVTAPARPGRSPAGRGTPRLRVMTEGDLPGVLVLEDDLFGEEAWSGEM